MSTVPFAYCFSDSSPDATPSTVRITGSMRSVTTSWLTSTLIGSVTPSQAAMSCSQTPPASTIRFACTRPPAVSRTKPGATPRTAQSSRNATPA
jgi:hypothetical protein